MLSTPIFQEKFEYAALFTKFWLVSSQNTTFNTGIWKSCSAIPFCLQKCLVCLHYAPELVSKIYLSRELDWFFLPFEKPSLIFGKRPEHDFSLRESAAFFKSSQPPAGFVEVEGLNSIGETDWG